MNANPDRRYDASVLRTARWSISAIFLINGTALGSWASNLPLIKERLGIDEAQLGFSLLTMALGAVLAMLLVGPLNDRHGSRGLCLASGFLVAVLLPFPAIVPSYATLLMASFALGIANGTMDVSMNAHGVAVEKTLARPIMSSLHAFFSIGGIVAALTASGGLALGLGLFNNLFFAAVLLFVAMIFCGRGLLPSEADAVSTGVGGTKLALPVGPLAPVGMMALIAFLAEGSMIDWAAVYLREGLATSSSVAALGFGVFAGAMALGRLTGDAIISRFGRLDVLRVSAVMAIAGFALALIPQEVTLTLAGYALIGLGVANVVPIMFSVGGSMPGVGSGTGIAAIATAGYGGALIGPALIGFIAHATSLRMALGLGAVLLVVIPLFSGRILHAQRRGVASVAP
ncbi:MAG: MFS transporter [Geminicoccaceae bacterium]|nr:MFS transporter [Geminicoccaceae bacterium]